MIAYVEENGEQVSDEKARVSALQSALKSLSGREYRTVAVLTRSLREATELYADLEPHFEDIHLIDGSMTRGLFPFSVPLQSLSVHLTE